ncbi:MAG TPA: hypothetical protein DDZ51_23200 [Planctomycetaceae bacterium]|nr:hypothetical protein [Planctomycetaceae bacterium]
MNRIDVPAGTGVPPSVTFPVKVAVGFGAEGPHPPISSEKAARAQMLKNFIRFPLVEVFPTLRL